eukprot:8433256-Alexandrium_andersonii.AAC.1
MHRSEGDTCVVRQVGVVAVQGIGDCNLAVRPLMACCLSLLCLVLCYVCGGSCRLLVSLLSLRVRTQSCAVSWPALLLSGVFDRPSLPFWAQCCSSEGRS